MRKKSILAGAAVLVAGVLFATGASAESVVTAENPNAVRRIASGYGSADIEKDGIGDPMIVGKINGVKYAVYFYGCDDDGNFCNDIKLRASWDGYEDDTSLDEINDWNNDSHFGKAYIESDGDVVVSYTVNLNDGGVTASNLDDTFEWWVAVLSDFKDSVLD